MTNEEQRQQRHVKSSEAAGNEHTPESSVTATSITFLDPDCSCGASLDAPLSSPRHISAEHLLLALVSMKARPGTRWAALSDGTITPSCADRKRGAAYSMPMPPLLTPLARGLMNQPLQRVRLRYGRKEVQRTWGAGMRVLAHEFSTVVIRRAA